MGSSLRGLVPILIALLLVSPVRAQCPPPNYDCSQGCDLVQYWTDCLEWYQCGSREGPSCPVCAETGYEIRQWNGPEGECNILCGYLYDYLCSCLVYCVE